MNLRLYGVDYADLSAGHELTADVDVTLFGIF